jgi:hypothetical protein
VGSDLAAHSIPTLFKKSLDICESDKLRGNKEQKTSKAYQESKPVIPFRKRRSGTDIGGGGGGRGDGGVGGVGVGDSVELMVTATSISSARPVF